MAFSQYAPANESAADLWLERSNLDGAQLGAMAYGILVAIFTQCMYLLWDPPSGRRDWRIIGYTFFMFTLGTLGNAGNMKFNELTFVDARGFPGGPNGFVFAEYNFWVGAAGTICFIIASWFQDGLLLFRLWVIWESSYKIIVFPILMLIGSIIMSCFLMFQLTQPGKNLWTTVNFALPYWTLSISLNVISTALIVGRLLIVRHRVRSALGDSHARYTSIAAMLIESAALDSITGLIFIISYARNSNVQNLVLPALGQVECIAPLLIIMRVAQGRAWSKDTLASCGPVSEIKWGRSTQGRRSITTTGISCHTRDMEIPDPSLTEEESTLASRSHLRLQTSGVSSGSDGPVKDC